MELIKITAKELQAKYHEVMQLFMKSKCIRFPTEQFHSLKEVKLKTPYLKVMLQ